MSFWERAFGNIYTTLGGVIAGAATYTYGVGGKIPDNKQEWAMAAASIALMAMGVLGKDASTGSAPGTKS